MPFVLAMMHDMTVGGARLALVTIKSIWPVAVKVAAGTGMAGRFAAAVAVIAGLAGCHDAAADGQ